MVTIHQRLYARIIFVNKGSEHQRALWQNFARGHLADPICDTDEIFGTNQTRR